MGQAGNKQRDRRPVQVMISVKNGIWLTASTIPSQHQYPDIGLAVYVLTCADRVEINSSPILIFTTDNRSKGKTMMKTGNILAIAIAFLMLHSTVYAQDLSPPSNVTASDGTFFARVEITWDAVAGAEFYRVFRCIDRRNTCGFRIAGPTGTSFNDSRGNPGQEYYYRVRACSTIACSRFSIADSGFRTMTLKEVTTLLSGVTRTTVGGNDKLVFSGMNVQIVNGEGITSTANSAGNLIIGYNEERDESLACPGDTVFDCNRRNGSHNVVIGDKQNYTSWGGFIAGFYNEISGEYASVSGGARNRASGIDSSVSGGEANRALGIRSSVSGGHGNEASGPKSSISGGLDNLASADVSSVSGGEGNTASADVSSVSGGENNTASGRHSSVSGGHENTASGQLSSISGGFLAVASGRDSSVSGGEANMALGLRSSVSGGHGNDASGPKSSISGGLDNKASADVSAVSGGASKTAATARCIVGDNGVNC